MHLFAKRTLILKVVILVALAAVAVFALSEGPPPGFTGSPTFGEPNCTICHSSFSLDAGVDQGGALEILGVPDQYTPGETYTITVQLSQPEQKRWGFELAVRDADTAGQAGMITLIDPINTQLLDFDGIQYVYQTGDGTYNGTPGGVAWPFNWTAPDSGTVVFSAAGNAADGDMSAQGDYIYVIEQATIPVDYPPTN